MRFLNPLLPAFSLMPLVTACITPSSASETSTNASETQTKSQPVSPSSSSEKKGSSKSSTTRVQVHTFANLALLGTAYFPKTFGYPQGGWSGASRVLNKPGLPVANEFWTVNDRGLNLYLEAKDSRDNLTFTDGDRYFPDPKFNQSLLRIQLAADGTGRIVEQIGLSALGIPTSGLPSAIAALATGERPFEMKSPTGPFAPLAPSLQGFDFEGVAQTFDKQGKREFWLVEEYGPSILRADANGNITQRWSPDKNFPQAAQSLPAVIRQRADNRGFEGLTVSGDFVFAAMQSPLDAAGGPSGQQGHGNKETGIHRIMRIQRSTGRVEQFAYVHSPQAAAAGGKRKDVKIGDLAPLDESGQRFLVLEHSNARKHIAVYEAQVTSQTTRLADSNQYEAGKLAFNPLTTRLVADLSPLLKDLELPEKAEGLSWIDERTLVVIFDNDHCIEPLLAAKTAAKECENLAITVTFPAPVFEKK